MVTHLLARYPDHVNIAIRGYAEGGHITGINHLLGANPNNLNLVRYAIMGYAYVGYITGVNQLLEAHPANFDLVELAIRRYAFSNKVSSAISLILTIDDERFNGVEGSFDNRIIDRLLAVGNKENLAFLRDLMKGFNPARGMHHMWIVDEVAGSNSKIPKLSEGEYKKLEAIILKELIKDEINLNRLNGLLNYLAKNVNIDKEKQQSASGLPSEDRQNLESHDLQSIIESGIFGYCPMTRLKS